MTEFNNGAYLLKISPFQNKSLFGLWGISYFTPIKVINWSNHKTNHLIGKKRVLIYNDNYMSHDQGCLRSYMSCSNTSMLELITSSNLK